MDPADPNQVKAVLEQQGIVLGRHQTQLEAVASSIRDLTAQIQPLQLSQLSAAAPSTSSSPPVHEPKLPPPEKYSGEPGTCRSFLSQCSLVFELQPTTFPSERAKVAYVITQLSGRARERGTALWEARSPSCGNFEVLAAEMRRIFDRSKHGHEAARELLHMHQGRRSVSDFAIDFQTLATSSGWNPEALFDTFLNGLSEEIKDELVAHNLPDTCEGLVDLAIRIDTRLQQRRRARALRGPSQTFFPTPATQPTFLSASDSSGSEPMQIDRTRLTTAERQRRLSSRSCLYCGQPGHFISSCPVKANTHQ